ncbi:MAG: Trp family transcriptional regulator [Spirochaetales bacterium]
MKTQEHTTVNEDTLNAGLKELYKIICDIEDPQMTEEFFDCLFTPAERKDIASRWLLVKEINKGTAQRDIAKMFSMSLCKITRGSKELKKPNSAFRKILDRIDEKNR